MPYRSSRIGRADRPRREGPVWAMVHNVPHSWRSGLLPAMDSYVLLDFRLLFIYLFAKTKNVISIFALIFCERFYSSLLPNKRYVNHFFYFFTSPSYLLYKLNICGGTTPILGNAMCIAPFTEFSIAYFLPWLSIPTFKIVICKFIPSLAVCQM